MDREVVSQAEVDSLLRGPDGQRVTPPGPAHDGTQPKDSRGEVTAEPAESNITPAELRQLDVGDVATSDGTR